MESRPSLSPVAKRLEGKVALITGGASGIGECTARLFALHGAKIIIADIQDDLGRHVCSQIGPDSASFIHCDVTSEPDVANAVDYAVSLHGKLDIMLNNAGILDIIWPLLESDADDFDRVMATIAKGSFLGTKHAARVMIPRGRGSIIATASAASVIGGIATYAYTCAKHAVAGLTKNAAAELGRYGIRVNCVSPMAVATPMTMMGVLDAEAIENAVTELGNLKGTALKPEDVAQAILYVASDESKYVSGHNLMVDGGYTIVNPSIQAIDPAKLLKETLPKKMHAFRASSL